MAYHTPPRSIKCPYGLRQHKYLWYTQTHACSSSGRFQADKLQHSGNCNCPEFQPRPSVRGRERHIVSIWNPPRRASAYSLLLDARSSTVDVNQVLTSSGLSNIHIAISDAAMLGFLCPWTTQTPPCRSSQPLLCEATVRSRLLEARPSYCEVRKAPMSLGLRHPHLALSIAVALSHPLRRHASVHSCRPSQSSRICQLP